MTLESPRLRLGVASVADVPALVIVHDGPGGDHTTFKHHSFGPRLAEAAQVIYVDLRGHGRSDGDYTTLGLLEPDHVSAAVTFARSRDPGPVALLGYSMGGALALETGVRDPGVAAVVEDSGYGNLDNVYGAGFQRLTGLPALPFGLPLVAIGRLDLRLNLSTVRPIDDAARLRKPLLAIVGTADRVVPPSEGYDIYRVAPGPKQLLVLPGVGHVDGYRAAPARYREAVLGFLARSIG